MSKKNNSNARGIHVSPGIYTKETELTYAVKSLGITTLGVVGETLRGPAFQPMLIENWREFTDVFGGTSTEKFKDTQYPKYELPYVAKSYLSESNQLQVCRVLGLSGYNAGPAWIISANYVASNQENIVDNVADKQMIVAVLRSRGDYSYFKKYNNKQDCTCPQEAYDVLTYRVGEVSDESRVCTEYKKYNDVLTLDYYTPIYSEGSACGGYTISGTTGTAIPSTPSNLGRFKIKGLKNPQKLGTTIDENSANSEDYFEYAVSLNPLDQDYILKVLGTNNDDSDAPIFVEALYDVALKQMVEAERINEINLNLTFIQPYHKSDFCGLAPISGLMTKEESALTRRDVGTRVLASKENVENGFTCHAYDIKANKFLKEATNDLTVAIDAADKEGAPGGLNAYTVECGQIYTVKQYTDSTGKRHYFYAFPEKESINNYLELLKITDTNEKNMTKAVLGEKLDDQSTTAYKTYLVFNQSDNQYWRMCKDNVEAVTLDMNDYQSAYRFASTPWIVSNVKGDADRIELNKLFRFHTISDGATANNEIKVSIENIKPNEGLFDVVIRDINDSDTSIVALEKYSKCNLIPSDNNYIAYKIGSYDGIYESKSKYVTVEVNENLVSRNSVPAGFLGYPMINLNDSKPVSGDCESLKNLTAPYLKYNLDYDEDLKNRKQYFGFSDLVGIDVDIFNYKGVTIDESDLKFLTPGFHLDSRVTNDERVWGEGNAPKIQVDGQVGYKFNTVSTNNRTLIYTETPIIGTEEEMYGCIYEMTNLRKFTVCFYGGFDGWDIYRGSRTNTDEYKLSKYRGQYDETSGEGSTFNRIDNPDALALNQHGITSDWYAYLSGIRQFANPEAVDINVFATCGIDFVNNKTLVEETIEMIEEERADSIYVVTCPDKPSGAADYVDEMYTPEDIVAELEDTEIDSNYTCTYFPWVKYFDQDNSQYIYLPATKDVVRNMAMTDNVSYPWFAPAGIGRGDVNCVRAHYVTKLADEDVLYEGRINPIKTFAQDGVKIWGQKNLQIGESQLNRIAVRRLLLRMRKLISIACLGLIFEPNDPTTKQKFLSTVTPIMDNIRANRGISDYRIEVNDTVESRERRELPVKLYIKPYNALEYIDITFVVTPESVSFDDI